MRALSAEKLLNIWECGVAQQPADQAMELLAAARPESTRESLAELSMGQRTGELLMLRELLFGRQMTGVVACPRCAEQLELSLDAAELRSSSSDSQKTEISMSFAGYDIALRLPTSSAVVAAASQPELARGRSALLQHCLLAASCDGAPVSSDQLPAEVIEAVGERLAEADPLADIQIAMACPSCSHA